MARPRVAIVGSVDETRVFDPPVTDPAAARQACEDLGRELAKSGWDVVVYSAKRMFIEADVVRGYVAYTPASPGSIHVHSPLGKGSFDELRRHPELFDVRADSSRDWEVSFYRSLAGCDGVILIGGGRSTLVTGLIALTMRIPLVAMAAFGGNARKVWDRLHNERGDATEEDVAEMATEWRKDSARKLVEGLDRQRNARAARERDASRQARKESRHAQISLTLAVVLLLGAVAALVLAWGWRPGTAVSVGVLAIAPALSAAGGALIRTSLDAGRDWGRAGVLGGAAGLITGLLYIASQLVGAPDVLEIPDAEGVRRPLFFVLPIGFVAGLTFDAVFAKLRGADVSQADALANAVRRDGALQDSTQMPTPDSRSRGTG
jgi:hypothetical protein